MITKKSNFQRSRNLKERKVQYPNEDIKSKFVKYLRSQGFDQVAARYPDGTHPLDVKPKTYIIYDSFNGIYLEMSIDGEIQDDVTICFNRTNIHDFTKEIVHKYIMKVKHKDNFVYEGASIDELIEDFGDALRYF